MQILLFALLVSVGTAHEVPNVTAPASHCEDASCHAKTVPASSMLQRGVFSGTKIGENVTVDSISERALMTHRQKKSSCDFNCDFHSCSMDDVCYKCKPRYGLKEDDGKTKCKPCTSYCSQCTARRRGTYCQQCDSGYVKVHVTHWDADPPIVCQPCAANCQSCNNAGANRCDHCKSGYTVSSTTRLCDACASHCNKCDTAGKGLCDTCNSGYIVNTTTKLCQPCAPNCHACATSGPGKCDHCNSGYTVERATKLCAKCAVNCHNCDHNGARLCDQCKNGYSLNQTSKLCLKDPSSFEASSASSSSTR